MSVEPEREVYRRQMVGRLRMWESQLIHLRIAVRKLEGDARQMCEMLLRELETSNSNVVDRYADLLLANHKTWDEKRMALDTAADELEGKFIDFAMQAV